jgi:hypothetical protein
MSQVQQTQEEVKQIPLPVLQPAQVERIIQMVNEMPTMYGRPLMNFIETIALQQYQESQKAPLVEAQEVVAE